MGGEGSRVSGDIERSSLRAPLIALSCPKKAGRPSILGHGVQ